MPQTYTEQDVARALDACRNSINEFKRARLVTEAAMNGIIPCKYTQGQLIEAVQRARDPLKERVAAEEHRDFLRMLYRREPTAEELRAGPPTFAELQDKLVTEGVAEDAMGVIWLLPLAAIAGGAWGLQSVFGYLSLRERRLQDEANIRAGLETASMLSNVWDTIRPWTVPAVLGVGVAGLAYWYLFRTDAGKGKVKAVKDALPKLPAKAAAKAEMKANADDSEDEDEDEDETESESSSEE